MTTGRSDGGASRLLDGAALALFAAHVALRLSLRSGEGAWGANLFSHLLAPLGGAVWLTARALERRLPWRLTGLEIPLAALAGISVMSIFGASYRLAAMDGAAGLGAAILIVPLVVHAFGPERRRVLIALMAACVTVITLYGVVQYVELGELKSAPGTSVAVAASEDPGEFEGRLKAREPWSTLHYPNTFAGFLVLALPFIAGVLIDARSRLSFVAGLPILASGAFCLWATGSGGAGVAVVVAVIAFAALALLRRRPEWRKSVLFAAGGAVAVAVVLVATGPLSPNSVGKKSEALAIRDVYWDSALGVAKAHPLGVGLGNFEDHYYEHKDDRQEEVRNVHNDYLQVLAELGIPGLLAFLGLLVMVAFVALRPSEASSPVATSSTPIAAGLGLGWIAAFGLQGSFGNLGAAIVLGAAGIGTFLVFTRASAGGDFTRIGLAAGLAGAAVHMLVDFDLCDPAFRAFLFLSIAALAVTGRLEAPSLAGTALALVAAVVLYAIALPLAALVVPGFLESDEAVLRAETSETSGRTEEADALLQAAAFANPLDPDPAVRSGLRELQAWHRSGADDSRQADLALAILDDALRRRPRSASIEARLAEGHEALARWWRARSRTGSGMDAATAEAHQGDALRHARRAVELYPTRAYHQYLLGRIIDASGHPEQAKAPFREALRLSALARRVPRLGLDGLQAALATAKTDGPPERAVEIFRAWRRSRPPTDDRWRSRLPLLTPAEKSIVDAAADSQ